MEKVLVLAAGLPQVELIKNLKQRGYFVILIDYNDNPVAKEYCDKFYQLSTLNEEAVEKVALEEKVKYIITVCTDQALLTVAKISEKLNLPTYLDYKTALNATNKEYMKKCFIKNNITTANYKVVDQYDDDLDIGLKYPLIVKPVDCNSSKGVTKVEEKKDLKEHLEKALHLSRNKKAIIEEFIDGEEISADIYVHRGEAILLATSFLEKIGNKNKFVIYKSTSPATKNSGIIKQIKDISQQIADSFNIKNSPMLIQMIVKDNKVYVVEFSARTGGGEKFITIKQRTGFDVINAVIDLVENKKINCDIKTNDDLIFTTEFIYCNNGIFDHVDGDVELLKDKTISSFMLFKNKGTKFDSIENSGDRVAGYIIQGKDTKEIKEKHKKVDGKLKVIDIYGNDIMKHIET